MRLSESNEGWVVGFEDETWWSRLALPSMHTWGTNGEPSRLFQRSISRGDPEPKAISCYGLYLPELQQTRLRFVDGRPVSGITTRFFSWCSEKLVAVGKRVLILVWDNASWHKSKEVRRWIGEHNREVKKGNKGGVRIIGCLLPKQSPWLNPIKPKWAHGKRRVVDADGPLGARELVERVCAVFECPHYEHLPLAEDAVWPCTREPIIEALPSYLFEEEPEPGGYEDHYADKLQEQDESGGKALECPSGCEKPPEGARFCPECGGRL